MAHSPDTNWQSGVIVGWCGMRGIVTIPTALALPENFPHRGLMLVVAFTVTLGTLVCQGLTLRPLVALIGLHEDDPVDAEVRQARVQLADAALAVVGDRGDQAARELRDEIRFERQAALDAQDGDGRATMPAKQLRARTLVRRRERLLALRRDDTIGDDAFHRLEEELDYADLAIGNQS